MSHSVTGEQAIKSTRQRRGTRDSRIQRVNREKILDAATQAFAQFGFRGATVAQIAKLAKMSKPNLLYYFSTKERLYLAVLQRILDIWLRPLSDLDPEMDPKTALGEYIDQKIELSRNYPLASKVFVNEITAGAPILKPVLRRDVRQTVKKKARVLRGWAKAGKIRPIDPYHFIFSIWAVTQHYADFSVQIEAVTGKSLGDPSFFRQSKKQIKNILLSGLLPLDSSD